MTDDSTLELDCGRTLDELSLYLAADRTPRDPHIESCPDCLNVLQGLMGVSKLSHDLFADDIEHLPPAPEHWITSILHNIQSEVRAGRSIPIHHPDPRVTLSLTEGAVRALIRAIGDEVPGLVIGRCRLDGDVETPGAEITVQITASIAWGQPVAEIAATLRTRVFEALALHTELTIAAVDITIEDLHVDAIEEPQP